MAEKIHFIGNAHVDPAWMWRLEEGFESFLATCRSAIARMRETEGFIFTASSAALYEFVEKTDPKLFEEIKRHVTEGRWEIVGGWWVEADCNIPSGESFLRQALQAQEYFYSRFGRRCETGFCIDSFGHHANLPQLLTLGGMKQYVFMRPADDELSLPSALFHWEAPSGDSVLAYRLPFHYSNYKHSVTEKLNLLKSSSFYSDKKPWALFYGVGNHGGGPTKEQIAQVVKLAEEGKHEVAFGSLGNFFREASRIKDIALPRVQAALEHHAPGCYSNHSLLKKLNREAENALLRAEKFCILAGEMADAKSDLEALRRAWKNMLLNQFHDTLGGVSIKEACDDAVALYHEAIATARREERFALQTLANNIDTTSAIETLLVFNPHPFEMHAPLEFELWHPESSEKGIALHSISLTDSGGNKLSAQKTEASGKIGGDRVAFAAQAALAPFGWSSFTIERNAKSGVNGLHLEVTEKYLASGKVKICFDGSANPALGAEINYETAIAMNDASDTWGHGVTKFNDVAGEFKIEKVRILERGPVRARARITSRYGNSLLTEDILLYADSDEIEIRSHLNWQEKRKLLKLRFAHNAVSPKFTTEIPYSFCDRNTDGTEYPSGAWMFVTDSRQGIGVITNSKSAASCDDKYLYVTVCRSPLYAHHVPPHSVDVEEGARYIDQGEQEFSYKIVLGEPSWQKAEMPKRSAAYLQKPVAKIESSHGGRLPGKLAYLKLAGSPSILCEVVKQAESGKGIVLRFRETLGASGSLNLEIQGFKNILTLDLKPYDIKQIKVLDNVLMEVDLFE